MNTQFDLMVAPTGARLRPSDHAHLPITPEQIAETAAQCAAAGAGAIHVHVRDAKGAHALDPASYADAIRAIRARTDIGVQVSTEAAGVFDAAAQRACLAKVPATDASVSLREMSRDPDRFAETYALAAARGIDVQHILYSADEVTTLLHHFESGTVSEQTRRAIFVLGRYAVDKQSTPADLAPFLTALGDSHLRWSACAFGAREQECLLAALDHGGHVRIGFENNMTAPNGQIFTSNAASVASFVTAAEAAGFTPRGAST